MPASPKPDSWYVYLLRCRDGSLYCGISNDVARRVDQHNSGKGAKYVVPSRRPAVCAWKRRMRDRSAALGLEHWIKRQSVDLKVGLVQGRAAVRAGAGGTWKTIPKVVPKTVSKAAPRAPSAGGSG